MTLSAPRTLPELDPNKIRLAVGTPEGPRSAWWYVHMEKGANVYVGAHSLGGHLKLSLHGDRWCQFGFPSSRLDVMRKAGLPAPKNHYFFRWQRSLTPEKGAVHVASIIFPTDLLNKEPPPIQSRKITFLYRPAPIGHALEFAIFYSTEPACSLEERFLRMGAPMIYNQLDSGELVHLINRVIPFDTPAFVAGDWGRPQPLSGAVGVLQPGRSMEALRASYAMTRMSTGASGSWRHPTWW